MHQESKNKCILGKGNGEKLLTFTLQTLSHDPPEQGATVVTERRDFVVVDAEFMRNVDPKSLFSHLQRQKESSGLKFKHIFISWCSFTYRHLSANLRKLFQVRKCPNASPH